MDICVCIKLSNQRIFLISWGNTIASKETFTEK